jgi:hypothetical protein
MRRCGIVKTTLGSVIIGGDGMRGTLPVLISDETFMAKVCSDSYSAVTSIRQKSAMLGLFCKPQKQENEKLCCFEKQSLRFTFEITISDLYLKS